VVVRPDQGGSPPPSTMFRWIVVPTAGALLLLVTVGVGRDLTYHTTPVMAAGAAALAIALAGTGWAVFGRVRGAPRFTALTAAGRTRVAALMASGLAGAVLVGLLPHAPGYLVVFMALTGLAMGLPLRPAVVSCAALFAAANLALVLPGSFSPAQLVGQDVAMAFFFAVGASTRSALVSRAEARAAQARAEDLLAQLRASQSAQEAAAALGERTRLAREVHDILAHSLAGLVLTLDTAEMIGRRAGTDPRALAKVLEQVVRAQRIARDGLADTRGAISALRGDELPGPALLHRLVRETAEATGIRAALTLAGEQRPLSPEIGLALYRTAQEALINTAKYAGRDGSAELRLSYRPDDVELEIEDARAADAAPPGPGGLTFGGYGLTGMRERAELLGGQLTAGPTDRGFRVRLWLPAGRDHHPAHQPAKAI
jgi:signal transduction histidine kinase